jgi:1,5-anhydro-D-fructose reductase (1,5-anhydro-D-mannitol-forming)
MRNSMGGVLADVRWGIIGCGDVCVVKSGPAFGKAEGSTLQAVCRRTRSKAQQYAQAHNVPSFYSSADELLLDENIDAVYIATNPDSHLELALKAAQKGFPTLLEKPMGRCTAEASVISAAFEQRGIPLFVAYYRRSLPRYIRAKELLSRIGAVRSILVEVRQPKEEDGWRTVRMTAGGGLFVDRGTHIVDLLDWMFGPVLVLASHFGNQSVSSWAEAPAEGFAGVEDHVFFAFSLPLVPSAEENMACFDFDHKAEPVDRISVTGRDGLVLSFPALSLPSSDPAIRINDASGNVILEEIIENPEHVHGPLIQSAVDELRGNTARCPSTDRNGLRASVVVDAALEWGRQRTFQRQQGFSSDSIRLKAEKKVMEALAASGRHASVEAAVNH